MRINRARRKKKRNGLTVEEKWELLCGSPGAFKTRAEYATAWRAHREELMASVNPLSRPAGWWALEFKGERRPGERDWQILERYGLLTPAEQQILDEMKPKWARFSR